MEKESHVVADQQDRELKKQELEDNKRFRERSLNLQSREFVLKTITNPLLIVLISVGAGIYGHTLVERNRAADQELQQRRSDAEHDLAQKRFCYDVARDLIIQQPARRQEAAAELEGLVENNLIRDCGGDLREMADFYSNTPPPKVETSVPDNQICEKTASIRELGWRSGHKTKFCIEHGYDGVHNPFGSYSSGGYCFKGNSQACIAKIQSDVG
jgi:hypothetical protein